jgi:hypothetical protein
MIAAGGATLCGQRVAAGASAIIGGVDDELSMKYTFPQPALSVV